MPVTRSLSVHVFFQGHLVTCIYYQICLEKHEDKRIGVGQAGESTGFDDSLIPCI